MAIKYKANTKGWDRLVKHLEIQSRASEKSVRIGVLGSKVAREGKGKLNNADIAIIHEFGLGDVPERSFLRKTLTEKQGEITKVIVAIAKNIVALKNTPDQGLDQLGAKVASMIKRTIVAGLEPPNAPSVLARKNALSRKPTATKPKPAGKAKPLIDTGALLNAISWLTNKGTGNAK